MTDDGDVGEQAATKVEAKAEGYARAEARTHMGATPNPRPVILDLSRLMSRLLHPTPTGIDRLELAYARHFLDRDDRAVGFEFALRGTGVRRCSRAAVEALVERCGDDWSSGSRTRRTGAAAFWRVLRETPRGAVPPGAVRLMVSHHHLDAHMLLERRRGAGRLAVYLHDAIPCEFPEYARPDGDRRHAARLRNALAVADGVIVNSAATASALGGYGARPGTPAPLVAPLGIDHVAAGAAVDTGIEAPYFLCLGTIEPRKNHLLLLHLWRQMAATLPHAEIPKLVIVGRRGWENENIVDLLDRCTALRGLVIEEGRVGDARLAALMQGARAVLMPSFAEGFGLPVAEALAARVPVLASDIAVLRETGGEVPEYLDPLDGPGWRRTILDYAASGSAMRAAQMERMGTWQAPTWVEHFAHVVPFLDSL